MCKKSGLPDKLSKKLTIKLSQKYVVRPVSGSIPGHAYEKEILQKYKITVTEFWVIEFVS